MSTFCTSLGKSLSKNLEILRNIALNIHLYWQSYFNSPFRAFLLRAFLLMMRLLYNPLCYANNAKIYRISIFCVKILEISKNLFNYFFFYLCLNLILHKINFELNLKHFTKKISSIRSQVTKNYPNGISAFLELLEIFAISWNFCNYLKFLKFCNF